MVGLVNTARHLNGVPITEDHAHGPVAHPPSGPSGG